jgi:hypothetical protein
MIDHLAAGDGRLKTSLIIERELCRDPPMRAFAEAFDEQHRLHDQLREAVQADAGEAVIVRFRSAWSRAAGAPCRRCAKSRCGTVGLSPLNFFGDSLIFQP